MNKKDDDELLIAKVLDKQRFCDTRNKIQATQFLDERQANIVNKFLVSNKIKNYIFYGGVEEAERKILFFYPEKLENRISNINFNEFIKVVRITLPNEVQGEYSHRVYLGGLMKLGIEREKVGDILVDEKGADIIVSSDILKFLLNNISSLTRFNKSKIEQIELEKLRKIEIKKEMVTITIPSMRIDNIVSELAKCSRTKANEILEQERVLVNYEVIQKSSKEIKENDIVTIRGKGRFVIKEIIGNTRKERLIINVEKFC